MRLWLFNFTVHLSKIDMHISICVRLKAPLCCTQVIYIHTGGEKNAPGPPAPSGLFWAIFANEIKKAFKLKHLVYSRFGSYKGPLLLFPCWKHFLWNCKAMNILRILFSQGPISKSSNYISITPPISSSITEPFHCVMTHHKPLRIRLVLEILVDVKVVRTEIVGRTSVKRLKQEHRLFPLALSVSATVAQEAL